MKKGYVTNYETLKRAFANDDVVLMECKDVVTGKPVIVLCAVSAAEDDMVEAIPLAKMFDGNPYEELIPPVLE